MNLLDCDIEVIYWDRHDLSETISANETYQFKYPLEEGTSIFRKAKGYLAFRKYAQSIIKCQNYNGIILLQTTIGILLYQTLKKKYSGKYIVDIRDYTFERNKLFYFFEKRLLAHCKQAVISSVAFKNFLPPYQYTIVHNDSNIPKEKIDLFQKRKKIYPIMISYIGLIRFYKNSKRVIMKFANDNRFQLNFWGKGAFALKEFCIKNNINNVDLYDQFPPQKTLEFYYKTDIINNLYGNNSPFLDYALSNKLYYAAKLGIPILVCPDTAMEKVAINYGFGFCCDLDSPTMCDDLYEYYTNMDWEQFYRNCEAFIKQVDKENTHFDQTIKNFIAEV